MSKSGTDRPIQAHAHPRSEAAPVPEIQDAADSGETHVLPVITENSWPGLKVFHEPKDHGSNG